MDIDTDVLVIGGGMAGLVAGTVLAEAGQKSLVIQKGRGATASSSGAVDVIGYLPDSVEPVLSPRDALKTIASMYPLHPYSVSGFETDMDPEVLQKAVVENVERAVEWLKSHTEGTISPLTGNLDRNVSAVTTLGTSKPTCLVQETMLPSEDMHQEEESVLVFAGIKGYADFNPKAAAKTYLRERIISMTPPKKVVHGLLEIAPFGKPYNISAAEVARHLDHQGSVEDLIAQLRPHIEGFGATDVALPPILGVRHATENKSLIEKELGVRVFELLGLPPSVPGLRLQKALEQILIRKGGKLLQGFKATSHSDSNGLIGKVIASGPSRTTTIGAKAFILATGKFIGGGFEGDEGGITEPIFDLMPVTGDFYDASRAVPTRSTSRFSVSPVGQPVFSFGLSADPHLRPVNRNGTEWASNLFCAGSILAGYNYSTEKSGLGVAATTGRTTALRVIDYLEGGAVR